MSNQAFLVPNGWVGLIKEVTRGTTPGSGTPFYIPVTDPTVSPMINWIKDEALRGSPVDLYDLVPGARHDEFDHKSWLYADTFPVYVVALLGGTDTVTTSTDSYSHAIPLLNDAPSGSQPPSFSICNFDGANYFIIPDSQAVSLNLSFSAEAAAECTMKWTGDAYQDSSSAPAPFTSLSFSGEHLIPAWNTSVTIGGGDPITYVVSGELTIDRKTAPIYTMGTQSPYLNFAGGIDVSGKFTCVVASDADPFSISTSTGSALRTDQQTLVITLTDPADVNSTIHDSVTFTMSQVQFENPKRKGGKNHLEIDVEFAAEANATDAVTGYSPLSATIVNGVSAAFN